MKCCQGKSEIARFIARFYPHCLILIVVIALLCVLVQREHDTGLLLIT